MPERWRPASALPSVDDVVRADGPWTHRDVSANAARFHVVEAGEGPMVLLLHGFPTFWWTWRNTLTALAEAGYRAVAMDLRGYGGSDHTPHGYDPQTAARDIAGVIRCLGEADAVIVGHGWGGLLAWGTAVMQPQVVRGIAPMSMAHPRRLRHALLNNQSQRRAQSYTFGFQWPFAPERSLERDGAVRIAELLSQWSSPGSTWLTDEIAATYRAAFGVPHTAHCAVEYHRWALRSIPRRDGRGFAARMALPITVPVLQIHGQDDPSILLSTIAGSHEHVKAPYALRVLPDVGHFPQEEAAADTNALLLSWLASGMTWDDDGIDAEQWTHHDGDRSAAVTGFGALDE